MNLNELKVAELRRRAHEAGLLSKGTFVWLIESISRQPYLCTVALGTREDLIAVLEGAQQKKTIFITNETSKHFPSYEVKLLFQDANSPLDSHQKMSTYISADVGPFETVEVSLQGGGAWALSLRSKGYVFVGGEFDEQRGEHVITVQPGSTYAIIEDVVNPPLSESDCMLITRVIHSVLEADPALLPHEVFERVLLRIPPSIARNRSAKQLHNVFEQPQSLKWREFYRPILVQRSFPAHIGPVQCLIYWRALDRYPGGNCDVHTVCYEVVRDEHDSVSVRALEYLNW
jgi:hypothetical protein